MPTDVGRCLQYVMLTKTTLFGVIQLQMVFALVTLLKVSIIQLNKSLVWRDDLNENIKEN